ncbi:MAG: L-threonylcarbamoyladenylate synthase [Pseudomarimonas sp.]
MSDSVVSHEKIAEAVAALRRGECIGLPTETVYGLAADARNPEAVRRVFALKGRPADHPLIVHLPSTEYLSLFAREIPDAAWPFAQQHWPGPLTLVLKRAHDVPLEVTGGQDTIALRIPAHPVALAVLHAFESGLAAPSANRFGRISPTRAAHVRGEFGEAVPIVLDGGDCAVGIESTIVDLSGGSARILRPGMLTAEQLGLAINTRDEHTQAPRVPGALEQHYAPRTPLYLCSRAGLSTQGDGVQVLAIGELPPRLNGIALPRDAQRYAQGVYAALRELDARGAQFLLAELPPDGAAWEAIVDRLKRAAAGSSRPNGSGASSALQELE